MEGDNTRQDRTSQWRFINFPQQSDLFNSGRTVSVCLGGLYIMLRTCDGFIDTAGGGGAYWH